MTEVEQEIEQIGEEVDMENLVKEKTLNESENSATFQWKQKFKTIDDNLNDHNCDNAPGKAERSFEYTDSEKKIKIEWKINKEEEIHKRGADKVYKNKPDSQRAAKSVKNPSSSLKLFFMDKMMGNIVQYTNKNIQTVIDKFSDPLDCSTK